MPSSEVLEYNPNIIGFVSGRGPVAISLTKARELYGKLPSEYKLVSEKKGRKKIKVLNLALGKLLTEALLQKDHHLKKVVFDFFKQWHRDYTGEFGIKVSPFLNLNDPGKVRKVIDDNRTLLEKAAELNLRDEIERKKLIRKDVLNSIENDNLFQACCRILENKKKSLKSPEKLELVNEALAIVQARRLIENIREKTLLNVEKIDSELVYIFADEISREVIDFSSRINLSGAEGLTGVRGEGVEFEFAPRDASYLMLGKETGDCTADKSHFQADREVENIYWTVFPWILDRNYQILKVFFNGEFVMKVHLLPLFAMHETSGEVFLAVDAIETVTAFRDDAKGHQRQTLLDQREYIFNKVIGKIEDIGAGMGFERIYAEKFSNTKWIRNRFDRFPEIFLHVDNLIKLDELEDIYCLIMELSRHVNIISPREVFMEVQMKNTSLQPSVTHRTSGVKPYAVIRGYPEEGIPMKRVMGV